jgi:hypothetical protein
MPGPGQGKHAQKKKRRENANIAAVNAVLNTDTLTARADPLANETAPLQIMMATTATAAASSPVDPALDTSSFTYSHDEVQQLLEGARLDGWEEGYEEGSKRLMEGYRDGYEAGKKLGLEKEETARRNGLLEGHELGTQQGKDEERRKWLTEGHGAGLCLSMAAHASALFRGAVLVEDDETQTDEVATTNVNVQMTPTAPTTETASQTMQTALCVDFNTKATTKTMEATTQTADDPNAFVNGPPSPASVATSSLTTTAQPPSTSLTTTTIGAPPAPNQLPTPCKRRHSLPGRTTDPHPPTQPLISHPETPTAATTSQLSVTTKPVDSTLERRLAPSRRWQTPPERNIAPQQDPKPRRPTATPPLTTATTPDAQGRETTTWATITTQTAAPTSGTANQATNDVQRSPNTQTTELRDDERVCLPKQLVYSTERPCPPQEPQRRPVQPATPPSSFLPAPQTSAMHDESTTTPHASNGSATSSMTCPSTSAVSPALDHSKRWTEAPEPRNTQLEPSEQLQNSPHLPSLPPTPRKCAVSPPTVSHTPAASLTTPSTPAYTPCPLPTPAVAVSRPPSPVPPPLSPITPRSTLIPARFDWAEDAAALPTAPSTLTRDISGLKTSHTQPFGSLRRRTRRRRVPPQFFIAPRLGQSSWSSHVRPPYAQPIITRCYPLGSGPGKPVVTIPFRGTPTPAPVPPAPVLNWDHDPRLADLSRALRALGWTPPC